MRKTILYLPHPKLPPGYIENNLKLIICEGKNARAVQLELKEHDEEFPPAYMSLNVEGIDKLIEGLKKARDFLEGK